MSCLVNNLESAYDRLVGRVDSWEAFLLPGSHNKYVYLCLCIFVSVYQNLDIFVSVSVYLKLYLCTYPCTCICICICVPVIVSVEAALESFQRVLDLENGEKGEWGFKALKQMIKINFRLDNYDEMMRRYKQLLTYIKTAVTR